MSAQDTTIAGDNTVIHMHGLLLRFRQAPGCGSSFVGSSVRLSRRLPCLVLVAGAGCCKYSDELGNHSQLCVIVRDKPKDGEFLVIRNQLD